MAGVASWVAIVDDDPSVLKALARLVRTRGFRAKTFPSAQAFLEDGKDSRDLPAANLQKDLAGQLTFQRRWRIISMSAYVVTTVGTLACSAGATYFASGGGSPKTAAVLAGVATILVGTEKSLLFREKWKFHLLMYTKLNLLRAKLMLGRLNHEEASDEYAAVMLAYASELPMATGEQT